MVKVVLLQFIRGQLDEASLRTALKAQRTSKRSEKKAKLKADKIVKALTEYLEATDGATSTAVQKRWRLWRTQAPICVWQGATGRQRSASQWRLASRPPPLLQHSALSSSAPAPRCSS